MKVSPGRNDGCSGRFGATVLSFATRSGACPAHGSHRDRVAILAGIGRPGPSDGRVAFRSSKWGGGLKPTHTGKATKTGPPSVPIGRFVPTADDYLIRRAA